MLRVALCAGILALAGCSGQTTGEVKRGHSLPPPRQAAAPAQKPTMAEPSEAVWHLRAGLNVAALSCRGRGRTPVAGNYARLLTRHRALLAQAYAGEQKRYGKGTDRHLTQLYNRFSNQRNPAKFCTAAAAVAQRAVTMDSVALAVNARGLLGDLN